MYSILQYELFLNFHFILHKYNGIKYDNMRIQCVSVQVFSSICKHQAHKIC